MNKNVQAGANAPTPALVDRTLELVFTLSSPARVKCLPAQVLFVLTISPNRPLKVLVVLQKIAHEKGFAHPRVVHGFFCPTGHLFGFTLPNSGHRLPRAHQWRINPMMEWYGSKSNLANECGKLAHGEGEWLSLVAN